MSTRINYVPHRVIDENGISDGASIYVYQTGTTTKVGLFSDPACTLTVSNPYIVASGADIPPLYTTYLGDLRVKTIHKSGSVDDEDPYVNYISSADIAGLLGGGTTVAPTTIDTITNLQAITGMANGDIYYLYQNYRQGSFKWSNANLSSKVSIDAQHGIYIPPASDATGASGAWVRQYNGDLRAEWFGVTADGTTDDYTALQAANTYAYNTGGAQIKLPSGTIMISNSYTPLPNVFTDGNGQGVTILKASADGYRVIQHHGLSRSGNIKVSNLTVWGYADRNLTIGADINRGTFIGPCVTAIYDNVEVIYARQMSLGADATYAEVRNCYVHKGLRDGINLTGCNHVKIINNTIEEVGDDGIAYHSSSSTNGVYNTSCVIMGNRLEKAYGIKVLGAKNTIIKGNRFRFYMGYGIQVNLDTTSNEGLTTKYNVVIDGNSLLDGMNGTVLGTGSNFYSIWIGGNRSQGAAAANLGTYDSVSGAFILPAPYMNQNNTARGGNVGIVVTNNTVGSTLGPLGDNGSAAVNFSDFGFGLLWFHTGSVDAAISSTLFQMHGIYLTGDIEQLTISNNSFYGLKTALRLNTNVSCRNVAFRGNNIYRCQAGVQNDYSSQKHIGLIIEDNEINLDPYHESSQRVTPLDGTWTVSGTTWYAFNMTNTVGAIIRNNRIRNCMGALNTTTAVVSAYDNHLFWDWSVASAGIGNVAGMSASVNNHYWQDSNPTSVTYLQYSTTADSAFVRSASSIPTTGYYRAGQIVKNSGTLTKDASNMVLEGWSRLTSGNTHTSGTDWALRYISHVSPAT